MNGPEHYHAAETALGLANDGDRCEPGDPEAYLYIAEAQVHAILALAAAVAELQSVHLGENRGGILSRGDTDAAAWQEVMHS